MADSAQKINLMTKDELKRKASNKLKRKASN